MITHSRFTVSPFPIVFCLAGFVLMLGVILWSEDINQLLPIGSTIAEITPVEAGPVATVTISEPIAAIADENITTIINDPRNYRVVPKDIMPGQAILEGKTTKFLLGF